MWQAVVDSEMNQVQACSASLNLVQWFTNLADHRLIWGTFKKEVSWVHLRPAQSEVGRLLYFSQATPGKPGSGTSGLEFASWWCSLRTAKE